MSISLLKTHTFSRPVSDKETYGFEILDAGLYLISITARCRNWLQNTKRLFNDDDLAVEIDGLPFYEFAGKRKEFNTPASWNGNELKNLKKTVYFILPLRAATHALKFAADGAPFLERIEIYHIEQGANQFSLTEDFLPKEENGRLFFDIAFKGVAVTEASAAPKIAGKNKPQLKVDGAIVKNWSALGVAEGPDIHFFEFRAKNGAGVINLAVSLSAITLNRLAKVALYKDIVVRDSVIIRSVPDDENDDTILVRVGDGEQLEILEERVQGMYIANLSNIWHKVRHQNIEGYILSSYVEIEGQERPRVIELIREQAKKAGLDPNLAIALAGCESKYKPYTVSDKGAKGIFQLMENTINDLNNPSKSFYSPIADPFNVTQNIAGGVAYIYHLYDRYKNTGQRLERSLVAFNAGFTRVPADDTFNLKNYVGQPQALVACVLENKKNKSWSHIIKPLVIFLAATALVSSFLLFDTVKRKPLPRVSDTHPAVAGDADNLEYAKPKDEGFFPKLGENEVPPVSFAFNARNRQILFFNPDRQLSAQLSLARLELDAIAPVDEEDSKDKPIFDRAVEISPGVFYFLITRHGYCGSGGCTWLMYRYDVSRDELRLSNKEFTGSAHFFLSPDKNTLAILRKSGGVCFSKDYLEIQDIRTQKIFGAMNFLPENISENIQRLAWKDNQILEAEVYEAGCGVPWVAKAYEYNVVTGKKVLRAQKPLEAG